jgi:hypothetical protein
MLAALIRPIFNAEDRDAARDRFSEAVAALARKLPKVQADPRDGRGGRARLLLLPGRPPAQDQKHKSARAAQP